MNGKLATLASGTIAGSATNLYDCMRTAVSFGIPREEAIAAATMNPANQPLYHRTGSHIFSPSSSCILYSVTVPCKSVGTDIRPASALSFSSSIGEIDNRLSKSHPSHKPGNEWLLTQFRLYPSVLQHLHQLQIASRSASICATADWPWPGGR